MKFYCLKTCDTCRKALKQLRAAGFDPVIIDVRADGVPKDILQKWVKIIDWQTLLNTRSTTWRGLGDTDKQAMDQDKALALMALHPTLIKRPVIEHEGKLSVGWRADVQEKFGLS